MAALSTEESLNLKKMMTEMDYVDNTATIRKLKHSARIRDEINRLELLKKSHAELRQTDREGFFNLAYKECNFLFNNYMDLFTRVMKDEVDIKIMTKILIVLKLIEDERLDQNEGSVMVGRYLKEMYLDSAVRRADHMDSEREAERIQPVEGKPISWRDFKLDMSDKTT